MRDDDDDDDDDVDEHEDEDEADDVDEDDDNEGDEDTDDASEIQARIDDCDEPTELDDLSRWCVIQARGAEREGQDEAAVLLRAAAAVAAKKALELRNVALRQAREVQTARRRSEVAAEQQADARRAESRREQQAALRRSEQERKNPMAQPRPTAIGQGPRPAMPGAVAPMPRPSPVARGEPHAPARPPGAPVWRGGQPPPQRGPDPEVASLRRRVEQAEQTAKKAVERVRAAEARAHDPRLKISATNAKAKLMDAQRRASTTNPAELVAKAALTFPPRAIPDVLGGHFTHFRLRIDGGMAPSQLAELLRCEERDLTLAEGGVLSPAPLKMADRFLALLAERGVLQSRPIGDSPSPRGVVAGVPKVPPQTAPSGRATGADLRAFRLQRGVSQRELAGLLDVAYGTVSKAEVARTRPLGDDLGERFRRLR